MVDRTGDKCHLKQSGPVWFLAGTYGTRRTVRNCTIPRGKYVFFPLINYVVFPRNPADPPSCANVMDSARLRTDDARFLVLKLNGVAAGNLVLYCQATSTCFDLAARADGAEKRFPSAANGYYAMLRPLPPGKVDLDFGGILPSMVQAVTYHLVVK